MNEKIPQFWDKGPMVVTGCEKVSPGCMNCWSERAHVIRSRNPAVQHIYSPDLLTNGKFNGKVQFNLRLLEGALKSRKPKVIAPWNDLYHPGITDEQILKVFSLVRKSNRKRERKLEPHTILIITKRIERAADLVPRLWVNASGDVIFLKHTDKNAIAIAETTMQDFWPNIWTIPTCENQAMADKRIPHLLRIPGKRGIIIEPMLEEIDLNFMWGIEEGKPKDETLLVRDGIHQVILGPENGPGKRPFDPAWADSVKAQCKAAGVPFYRKDTREGTLTWR